MSGEQIAAEDANWIAFRRTPRVCGFFNRHAIFFGAGDLTPDPEADIRVSKEGRIEEYTLFGGPFAHPMGAFSYNHTALDTIGPSVGRYCSIGNHLTLFGERHPIEWVTTSNITYCFKPEWNKPHFLRAHTDLMQNRWPPLMPPAYGPNAVLHHDVWIAEHVMLARTITIGTGAIVGAGAVVTRDVDPYTIVAGNPARVIRRRFTETICERLLASAWWALHPDALFTLDRTNPEHFLDQLEARKSNPFGPCPVRSFAWTEIVEEITGRTPNLDTPSD